MPPPDDRRDAKRDAALLDWIEQFAPYGFVTLDQSFRVRNWNRWMELHSGRLFENAVGRDIFSLFPSLEPRRLRPHLERAAVGESSLLSTALHGYVLPLPSLMDEHKLMQQTGRIMPLLSEGEISGIVIVIEDVTQREVQAESLQRQHRRDEILSGALAHLLNSDEPRKTIRPLFFKIASHLDFDTFLLYLTDSDTGALALYTTGGVPIDDAVAFERSKLFADMAAGRKITTLNSIKASADPDLALLQHTGVSAMVAIPLLADERALGLVCFGTWSRETIVAGEIELLTIITQYLATAVDRDNARQQLEKTRAELFRHSQLLEERVKERTSRLQETISELEAFSYSLAHDLKAPVRGINGFCQVLLEDYQGKFPDEARQLVKRMQRSALRMDALIRDLLSLTRISRDNVALTRVDAAPIIEELLLSLPPAARRSVTLAGPFFPLRANQSLLQQVLSNLLDNALKFVPPGQTPRVAIRCEPVPGPEPGGRVRVWIEDEGIGIPAEMHGKIFGIFERGVISHDYEGTGMGLAIVARAVQRMGGTCGVESEVGKGSRFWVELPRMENNPG